MPVSSVFLNILCYNSYSVLLNIWSLGVYPAISPAVAPLSSVLLNILYYVHYTISLYVWSLDVQPATHLLCCQHLLYFSTASIMLATLLHYTYLTCSVFLSFTFRSHVPNPNSNAGFAVTL